MVSLRHLNFNCVSYVILISTFPNLSEHWRCPNCDAFIKKKIKKT